MARTFRTHQRWATVAVALAMTVGTALLASSANAAVPTVAGVPAAGPAAASAAVPPTWISEQVDFLLSRQLPSGAILGAGTKITPYFANIGAFGLVKADTTASRAGVHDQRSGPKTKKSGIPSRRVATG